MKENIKKLTYAERGRLGALALNSNPDKKREAAKKAVQTRMAKDPDTFKKMGGIRYHIDKDGIKKKKI